VKNLYFITKIFNAIESQDTYHQLEKAFEEIPSLGRREQYRQGYEQFVRFMEAAYDDMFAEDRYLGLVRSAISPTYPGIEIFFERNGACLATITFRHRRIVKTISNVAPGYFTLKFKIGRVIWSGELTRRDLVWPEAFPDKALRLAAKTEKAAKNASRIVRLYNDEIVLQVIPGIEDGNIEILFKGAKIEQP
jgi:hypothetical protein